MVHDELKAARYWAQNTPAEEVASAVLRLLEQEARDTDDIEACDALARWLVTELRLPVGQSAVIAELRARIGELKQVITLAATGGMPLDKLAHWGVLAAPAAAALQAPLLAMHGDESLIREALHRARMALLATGNCLATDRPDLPRAPDTGWTTDFRTELAAIDAAEASLTPAA